MTQSKLDQEATRLTGIPLVTGEHTPLPASFAETVASPTDDFAAADERLERWLQRRRVTVLARRHH